MNTWQYDEFQHCGVDYSNAKQAEEYDQQHQKFRNYAKEFAGMVKFLGLQDTANQVLIDLGCGTGATAIIAANSFKRVYAVDVSALMIEQAKRKLAPDMRNLQFVQAGFLTYEHAGEPADLVVTKAALHHLPDFWKQIALLRINGMLKLGGRLYLHDVVFQFEPQEYLGKVNVWVSRFEKLAGAAFKREVETHIRDEYSTFGWIMKGMLEAAGFAIEQSQSNDGFVTEYACRKVRELNGADKAGVA